MAAPSYTSDLTAQTISTAESTTGWTAVGGGGAITAETDFYVEGNASISKATQASWDSAGTPRGGVLYNNGSGVTVPTDGAVIMWMYWWAPGVLANEDAGSGVCGMEIDIGNSTTAYKAFNIRGLDTYQFGGWIAGVANPANTAFRTDGSPNGTWQYFGWQAYVAAATQVGKGNPWGCDVIRYGRCELRCTNGDVTNGYASFGGSSPDTGAAAYDNDGTRRWGLLIPKDGAFFQQGLFIMGLAGTAVDFRDSNRTIFIQRTVHVTAPFNAFEVRNAGSRVDWTAISVQALGTVSRGRFIVTDNADVNLDSCTFTDMDTFSFLSATDALNCTFRRCNAITATGSNLSGSTVALSTVAADASALVWTDTTNTDGKLDGMTFSMGTNSHHAISFASTTTPVSYTLRDIAFGTGFSASNGNTNSTFYVAATTGTVTINLTGCTGNLSYKSAGAIVDIVNNPVTFTVTVKDTASPPVAISGVQVLVLADTGGDMPVDATVTIASTGTTATVTHTNHGMANNDKVQILGVEATEREYIGVFTISNVTTNTYDYTMTGDPVGSSASGSPIKATYVALFGTTDGFGQATMSRVFTNNQPVTGRARKAPSGGPYYKTGSIIGEIDSSAGLSTTIQLISDE